MYEQTAAFMYNELLHTRLTVTLIPSRLPEIAERGGCIRIVESQNPAWYQALCKAYPSKRTRPRRRNKPDTAIKRQQVLKALQHLANGNPPLTEYHNRLLPYIESYSTDIPEYNPAYNPHINPMTPASFAAFMAYV